jgi:hypothetical protein
LSSGAATVLWLIAAVLVGRRVRVPVGFVSIGDLAIESDRRSMLADISDAIPNR